MNTKKPKCPKEEKLYLRMHITSSVLILHNASSDAMFFVSLYSHGNITWFIGFQNGLMVIWENTEPRKFTFKFILCNLNDYQPA